MGHDTRRARMVRAQIRRRGISDKRVLEAMEKVERHQLVISKLAASAYDDRPLPIGHGQTISQPYIVAYMTEKLELSATSRVLEVGCGSGYQAAVLAEIADDVTTLEIVPELAQSARQRLGILGYRNIQIHDANGFLGWAAKAPFDAIIVTAAPDHVPPPLLRQLKDGGNLVVPIGPPGAVQTLWLIEKRGTQFNRINKGLVRFVPFVRDGR